MTCLKDDIQGAEILIDYCAGALDAIRAAELDAHFHHCAVCRREIEAQQAIWKALDVWPPVQPSSGFDAKLYGRIAEEKAQPWWGAVLRRAPWKPLFPIAAATAAVGAVLLIWNPVSKNGSQPAPPAPAAEKIDVQQVEQALEDMDLLLPVGSSSRTL